MTPVRFVVPVPVGMDKEFFSYVKRLKSDGLDVKFCNEPRERILLQEGTRSLLNDYLTFEYSGSALEDGVDLNSVYINVGTTIALNGDGVRQSPIKSRSTVFTKNVFNKTEKFESSDEKLNLFMHRIAKQVKRSFASDYKPPLSAKACDINKFLVSASAILSRYHATNRSPSGVDDTAMAAYASSVGADVSGYKSTAWIDTLKMGDLVNGPSVTEKAQQIKQDILNQFSDSGSALGLELTKILKRGYIQQEDVGHVVNAVESITLKSGINIDKDVIRSLGSNVSDSLQDVRVKYVKSGLRPETSFTDKQYFVQFVTDNNEYIEAVSKTDSHFISKEMLIDGQKSGSGFVLSGNVVEVYEGFRSPLSGTLLVPPSTRIKVTDIKIDREPELAKTISTHMKFGI